MLLVVLHKNTMATQIWNYGISRNKNAKDEQSKQMKRNILQFPIIFWCEFQLIYNNFYWDIPYSKLNLHSLSFMKCVFIELIFFSGMFFRYVMKIFDKCDVCPSVSDHVPNTVVTLSIGFFFRVFFRGKKVAGWC